MIYNDCELGHCARCSAKFCIFERDAMLWDTLCVACWTELEMHDDSIGISSPPNPNECLPTRGEVPQSGGESVTH